MEAREKKDDEYPSKELLLRADGRKNSSESLKAKCQKVTVRLHNRTDKLKLFPVYENFASVGIDILGQLNRSSKGRKFLLVITDRFYDLTKSIKVRLLDALTVAEALTENWIFNYDIPDEVLSENGSTFASKFFMGFCQGMEIVNSFTSTYHPKPNEQTERFNRTILQIIRFYVVVHYRD